MVARLAHAGVLQCFHVWDSCVNLVVGTINPLGAPAVSETCDKHLKVHFECFPPELRYRV